MRALWPCAPLPPSLGSEITREMHLRYKDKLISASRTSIFCLIRPQHIYPTPSPSFFHPHVPLHILASQYPPALVHTHSRVSDVCTVCAYKRHAAAPPFDRYKFSQVFGPETRQVDLYNSTAEPLVKGLFQGQNGVCIFLFLFLSYCMS